MSLTRFGSWCVLSGVMKKVPSALYFFCSPRILLILPSETFVPFPVCFLLSTAAFCNVRALARLPPPSSSSSMALQLWYSLDLLNNVLPFKEILGLSCPFYKFHLFQVIPDIIFPSRLGPSYWSSCEWFPFVYFLYNTSFSHSIYVSKTVQPLGFNIIYYVPVLY